MAVGVRKFISIRNTVRVKEIRIVLCNTAKYPRNQNIKLEFLKYNLGIHLLYFLIALVVKLPIIVILLLCTLFPLCLLFLVWTYHDAARGSFC